MTLRAIDTLKIADVIAAEDTRHSGHLLHHFAITAPMVSYHEHNEASRTQELLERLRQGDNVAVITDAGLPSISDPGARLLNACIANSLPYTVIPGPSSVLTALVGSGFPAERFFFGGFLPVKSGQREREVRLALDRHETSIFFESPYRLLKTLEVAGSLAPERLVCVARELTKQFEEFRIGTPAVLLEHYAQRTVKGEITLLMRGRGKKEEPIPEP